MIEHTDADREEVRKLTEEVAAPSTEPEEAMFGGWQISFSQDHEEEGQYRTPPLPPPKRARQGEEAARAYREAQMEEIEE